MFLERQLTFEQVTKVSDYILDVSTGSNKEKNTQEPVI